MSFRKVYFTSRIIPQNFYVSGITSYHGIEFFWNFNAWMDIGGGIQLEIPRDTTYQDMDTTAS